MAKLTTIAGYRIKGHKGLTHWEPVLEEWLLATERYCRVLGGEDAPYSYTERANIGLLAAAAWRCGRVALEEFQYRKGLKNRKKKNGRADLYIASEQTEEMIEAKVSWVLLTLDHKKQLQRAESTLSRATEDARQTSWGPRDDGSVAVAFLPVWTHSENKDTLLSNIQDTVEAFKNSKFPLVAWSLPRHGRNLENSKGEVLPGIIMIAVNLKFPV